MVMLYLANLIPRPLPSFGNVASCKQQFAKKIYLLVC